MSIRLSYFPAILVLALSVIGGACGRAGNNQALNGSAKSSPGKTTEPNNNASPREVPTVNSDQPPSPEGAMILRGDGDVSLRRQGTPTFIPIVEKVWFSDGDTLQIGNTSSARVLCADRGLCLLGVGTYTACCTPACALEVQMMRRVGAPNSGVIVKKSDLAPADAKALNEAETKIRNLDVGQVTTQFLITNLYSNWKLEETNQQLDLLSNQLTKPEARQELKELYPTVTTKTGNMHLRFNRVEDAKKLYLLNLSTSPKTSNLKETAAAHAGLAQAYKQSGDTTQAVQNFEVAKDIYLKQGETKSAAATEKQILETKGAKRFDKATLPKAAVTPQK